MGFDLYGEEPKSNTEMPDWVSDYQDEKGWAKWDKIEKDKKNDEYFAATEKNEKENPGVYFRNNVWWWRPLWTYACDICEQHMSEKDLAAGDYNDGYVINKETAMQMAISLTTAEHDGSLDMYVKMYNKEFDKARANNKEVKRLKEELNQTVIEATGNKDTYPALYKGKHKKLFEELTEKENWGGHYPFHKDNAIAFRKFVEESGGFRIC
tara:strand:- start:832 stop:1461 length:630 start_codon:yes stop_codon:yes gene_type:complete